MRPIEALESRIAPASITFTDVDGDLVTVKSTKGDLESALTFSLPGDVPKQLQSINFEQPDFIGANLTVTAKQAGGGDGKVNVGQIRLGGGQAYGIFTIDGDLSSLGGGGSTGSIKKIVVGSLGLLGGSTQPGGTGNTFLQTGQLGALEVRGDVSSSVTIEGDLPSLKIRGNLLGGTTGESGFISIEGHLGTGVVTGVLQGGNGNVSGSLFAGSLGSLTVGGMRGGGGDLSGAVFATGTGEIGKLIVKGNVVGGTASDARQIHANTLQMLRIDGSLLGGNGVYDFEPAEPGQIFTFNGYGSILIKGDVVGGNTAFSGAIAAGEDTALPFSGQRSLGKVVVRGSLLGGNGDFSASLLAESAPGGILIGGTIKGGLGANSANIAVEGDSLGKIVVNGSIVGGDGLESGRLDTGTENGTFGTILVRGSVVGGAGQDSGGLSVNEDGITNMTILGNIVGGSGTGSGVVEFGAESGSPKTVVVGGSIRGGAGPDSGGLEVEGNDSGKLLLRGSIQAGDGARSGSLSVEEMRSVTVLGSVFGGFNAAGHISTEDGVGTLTIAGDVIGVSDTAIIAIDARPGIDASDPLAGQSIGKLVIGGEVRNAQILGGYGFVGGVLTAISPDVQIGSVQVLGSWTASSLVAGVDDGVDNRFGTVDDALIVAGTNLPLKSRIGSVSIGGVVLGTAGGVDAFGFVAQEIGAFRYAKRIVDPAFITSNFPVLIGPTNDVNLRIIP